MDRELGLRARAARRAFACGEPIDAPGLLRVYERDGALDPDTFALLALFGDGDARRWLEAAGREPPRALRADVHRLRVFMTRRWGQAAIDAATLGAVRLALGDAFERGLEPPRGTLADVAALVRTGTADEVRARLGIVLGLPTGPEPDPPVIDVAAAEARALRAVGRGRWPVGPDALPEEALRALVRATPSRPVLERRIALRWAVCFLQRSLGTRPGERAARKAAIAQRAAARSIGGPGCHGRVRAGARAGVVAWLARGFVERTHWTLAPQGELALALRWTPLRAVRRRLRGPRGARCPHGGGPGHSSLTPVVLHRTWGRFRPFAVGRPLRTCCVDDPAHLGRARFWVDLVADLGRRAEEHPVVRLDARAGLGEVARVVHLPTPAQLAEHLAETADDPRTRAYPEALAALELRDDALGLAALAALPDAAAAPLVALGPARASAAPPAHDEGSQPNLQADGQLLLDFAVPGRRR